MAFGIDFGGSDSSKTTTGSANTNTLQSGNNRTDATRDTSTATSGTSTTNATQQAAQQQTGLSASNSQQQQQQQTGQNQNITSTGVTSQLDDVTKQLLQHVLSTVGNNSGQLSDAMSAAFSGSGPFAALTKSGINIDNIINSAIGEAKQNYDQTTQRAINQNDQAGGSNQNSTSILMNEEGQRKLSTDIANIVGQIGLQGNAQTIASNTAALNAITGASTANAGSASAVGNVLKGADITQTSSQDTINQILSSLLNTGTTAGTTAQSGTSSATSGSTTATQQQQTVKDILAQLASFVQAGASSSSSSSNTDASSESFGFNLGF